MKETMVNLSLQTGEVSLSPGTKYQTGSWPGKNNNATPFPAIPAELPGIVVAAAENTHDNDVAEQEEAEESEVIENADLDREEPHLTFGQRDNFFENYDIGNVDMAYTKGISKEQLQDNILVATTPN